MTTPALKHPGVLNAPPIYDDKPLHMIGLRPSVPTDRTLTEADWTKASEIAHDVWLLCRPFRSSKSICRMCAPIHGADLWKAGRTNLKKRGKASLF